MTPRIPAPPSEMDGLAIKVAAAIHGVRYRTLARYWELAHRFQTLDPRPYSAAAPAMSESTLQRASRAVLALADDEARAH